MTDFVAGELLVGLNNQADYENAINVLEQAYPQIKHKEVVANSKDFMVALFSVPKGKEELYIKKLEKHPTVKYAELNHIAGIMEDF